MNEPRRYRFAPLDTTGWLYGLNGEQCLTLIVGIVTAGVALDAHAAAPFVLTPITIAVVAAFTRWRGMSVYEMIGIEVHMTQRRLRKTNVWHATTGDVLPPFLSHIEVNFSGPSNAQDVAIVNDDRNNCVSATINVTCRRFVLCESDEQERLLDSWADAFSTFATERSSVVRLSWTETAAKLTHNPSVRPNQTDAHGSALASYLALATDEVNRAEIHTTIVTLTVDLHRVRGEKHNKQATLEAGVTSLLEEVRLFGTRLADAGLTASEPLNAPELRNTIVTRLSPIPAVATHHRTLGRLTSSFTTPRIHSGAITRDHLRVDGTFHRTYWVRQWPRTEMGPNWLEPLMLHGGITRSFTVHLEPVAPSASRRKVDRNATKLETDATQRSRSGFRITNSHERAAQAVLDRENELGEGFVEFNYVGIVAVTATNVGRLRAACLDFEQTAAACGIDLSPLDGRHDRGMACALPLGQIPKQKRLS